MKTATAIIVAALIALTSATAALAGEETIIVPDEYHDMVLLDVSFTPDWAGTEVQPASGYQEVTTEGIIEAMRSDGQGPVITGSTIIPVPQGARYVLVEITYQDLSGNYLVPAATQEEPLAVGIIME